MNRELGLQERWEDDRLCGGWDISKEFEVCILAIELCKRWYKYVEKVRL